MVNIFFYSFKLKKLRLVIQNRIETIFLNIQKSGKRIECFLVDTTSNQLETQYMYLIGCGADVNQKYLEPLT